MVIFATELLSGLLKGPASVKNDLPASSVISPRQHGLLSAGTAA